MEKKLLLSATAQLDFNDVRQTEMHPAEPFKVETAIVKLKRYKSPGISQILAELIQAGCNTLHSEIHKH